MNQTFHLDLVIEAVSLDALVMVELVSSASSADLRVAPGELL